MRRPNRPTNGPPVRTIFVHLFVFGILSSAHAKPQWNPQDFYSNSYQYQRGYVPTSAFGMSNQYGTQNTNYGGFNRPFTTRPGSFAPYGNSYGGTVGSGVANGGSTGSGPNGQNTPESEENAAATHTASPDPHGNTQGTAPSGSAGVNPMGAQIVPGPTIMQNGMGGMSGPMNPMIGSPTMAGVNDMMNAGYGGMTTGMNQWPSNQQFGMSNNCFGARCNPGYAGGAAMSPNGFDFPGNGYGSNLGQTATNGGEDYNSAEDSGEMGGADDIEQANLRRYAEYLNLVNRRYGIGMPGQPAGMTTPSAANVITNGGGGVAGTGTFSSMNPMAGMNGMNSMNGMGGLSGLDLSGMSAVMNNGANGFVDGMSGMNTGVNPTGGITGGVASSGSSPTPTVPSPATPSGMGSMMGGYSAQPSMNGFTSGIVGYGSYMPQNMYETSNYPLQWPMNSGLGGALTNLGATGSNMGYGLDGYGATGSMPPEYLGMGGMTAMPSPAPYGYTPMTSYPMSGNGYPQNIMPPIYQQGVTATTGPPITPPELASKSREKSSQESSATSHEHVQPQSPPPATSIQALTQQIRRLPAVLYVDSKDTDGRHVENLLRDTYGLPLVSFYVDKIDKPKVVEKYLHQLTAHKGLPYLFICGTFIGSQEHIENYHKQKQIPQLVEYVCGEEKDKKSSHQPSSHKESTKKRKSSGRRKSRRQSKPSSLRQQLSRR